MNMPMYGWATPRGAWLAIISSLPYYGSEVVSALRSNGIERAEICLVGWIVEGVGFVV